MKQLLVFSFLAVLGAVSLLAQGPDPEPTFLDFGDALDRELSFVVEETERWRIDGTARYITHTQTLLIRGRYWTAQPIDPAALLSYQVIGLGGEVLLADGARYAFREAEPTGLESEFTLDLSIVSEAPGLEGFDVRFNAVMEGLFWYRDKFPEIRFPHLAVRGLPPRDHYAVGWTWVPRFLPAELTTRIPAAWRAGAGNIPVGRFVPAADAVSLDNTWRARSLRIDPAMMVEGAFTGWLPLFPQEQGVLAVRPGLVWDQVRWYDGNDWFERRTVRFVSPLLYLGVYAVSGIVVVVLAVAAVKKLRGLLRATALVIASAALIWWGMHGMVSGFLPTMALLVLAWIVARARGLTPTARVYLLAWLFMVFVDYFWIAGGAVPRAWPSSIVLSAGVWAFLLLPLVAIRRVGWQALVAAIITAGWWLTTTVAMVYHDFFRDFPSVGDLFYAGQIGELGDSVATLTGHRHWVPLVVWGLMLGVAIVAALTQRKTQAENA